MLCLTTVLGLFLTHIYSMSGELPPGCRDKYIFVVIYRNVEIINTAKAVFDLF